MNDVFDKINNLVLIFILTFLNSCAQTGAVLNQSAHTASILNTSNSMTYNINGEVRNNIYISPTNSFKVKIPPLAKPALIEDSIANSESILVSIRDNACREYVITETNAKLERISVDHWVDENIVRNLTSLGATLNERKNIQTHFGKTVFLKYVHPRAGPCRVTLIRGKEKPIEEQTDAEVGMYIFYTHETIYRVIYVLGIASPYDLAPVKRGPVDEVLADFISGLEVSIN